jgi:hypothetical protein
MAARTAVVAGTARRVRAFSVARPEVEQENPQQDQRSTSSSTPPAKPEDDGTAKLQELAQLHAQGAY